MATKSAAKAGETGADSKLAEELAARFAAALLPADAMDYVRAVSVMAWCAAGIHPKLTQQQRPERYCDLPGAADNVRAGQAAAAGAGGPARARLRAARGSGKGGALFACARTRRR
jgi:hypothetical protein